VHGPVNGEREHEGVVAERQFQRCNTFLAPVPMLAKGSRKNYVRLGVIDL
jgi:hypothetical protein